MFGEKHPQTFANHARLIPIYHFFAFGVLSLNLMWAIALVIRLVRMGGGRGVWIGTAMNLLVAATLVVLFFAMRVFALKAQDRVIRLEMRLRLREVLPADLKARLLELEPAQLIALRFAPDAELPELVRWVLADKVTDGRAIKSRIKDWQPDYLRV